MSLFITYTKHSGEKVDLTATPQDRPELIVGRRDGSFTPDIRFDADHAVSRRHARIYYARSMWYIEQLAEGNETRITPQEGSTITLQAGVAQELPTAGVIFFGASGKSVAHFRRTDEVEILPDGVITPRSEGDSQPIPEDQQIGMLARLTALMKQPGDKAVAALATMLQQEFPIAYAGGVALCDDKEIYVPAGYPPGKAEISFTLARRVFDSRRALRWDRSTASTSSQQMSSLSDTTQALYAPVVRGVRVIGMLYLHTRATFSTTQFGVLMAIADTLSAMPQFQPTASDLNLPSVFLSYSHQDKEFVRRLANDLRRQRVRVWFDERLRGGKEWEAQLLQAIQQSSAFGLVISPNSLSSKYVKWEIKQARAAKKPIFPLLHQPTTPVPATLKRLQWIDLSARYAEGVLELTHELYQIVDNAAPKPSTRKTSSPRQKIRILFLAANPRDTTPLRVDEEMRTIEERLRESEYRDRFDEPVSKWAVRTEDITEYLLRYKPHIVHFAGHGSPTGEIILENASGDAQPADPQALARLFQALKDNDDPSNDVRCVVLNACFAATQAQVIADVVGCVVGMSHKVSDDAAIAFAGSFYLALGYGQKIRKAFDIAAAEMQFHERSENPQLLPPDLDSQVSIFR
jgi:pSer/pThr/pTyr-binding forkhead associated (FHA) protein